MAKRNRRPKKKSDIWVEDIQKDIKNDAKSVEDTFVPRTAQQLSRALDESVDKKQIAEDIDQRTYINNDYNFMLKADDLDESTQQELQDLVAGLSIDRVQSSPSLLDMQKILQSIYNDVYTPVISQTKLMYVLQYTPLTQQWRQWFESVYTHFDGLHFYNELVTERKLQHIGIQELYSAIQTLGCTDQSMAVVLERVETYGIGVSPEIVYTGVYEHLQDIYAVDYVLKRLQTLPRSDAHRDLLGKMSKVYPDPLLRQMIVETERALQSKGLSESEAQSYRSKISLLRILFHDQVDMKSMYKFHLKQMIVRIRNGNNTRSIIESILNDLGHIQRDYEQFDGLIETMESMSNIYDEFMKKVLLVPKESKINAVNAVNILFGAAFVDDDDDIKDRIKVLDDFRSNMQKNLKEGKELDVAIVRSLPKIEKKGKPELTSSNEKDARKNIHEHVREQLHRLKIERKERYGWFEEQRENVIPQRLDKNNITYTIKTSKELDDEVRERLASAGNYYRDIETYPYFSFKKDDIESIQQAMHDIARFGFGDNITFPFREYEGDIFIEAIINTLLQKMKTKYVQKIKQSGSDKKDYAIGMEADVLKRDHLYQMFFWMMKNGDTSFLHSSLWKDRRSDRIYLGEKSKPPSYPENTHACRIIAAKLGHEDVLQAMLGPQSSYEEGYDRTNNTERLKSDFTEKKLEFLDNFVIKKIPVLGEESFVLMHISDQDKTYKLNPPQGIQRIKEKRSQEKIEKKREKRLEQLHSEYKFVDLYDIDGQSIVHHMVDDESMSEQDLERYIKWLGDDFDFSTTNSEGLTSLIYALAGKKFKKAKFLLDFFLFKIHVVAIANELNGKSIVHYMSHFTSDQIKVLLDLITKIPQFRARLMGYKHLFEISNFGNLLQHKNPETNLTGLQTLAEYGHIELAEELMEQYGVDIWKPEDTADVMRIIALSPHASVETLNWFDLQYKKCAWIVGSSTLNTIFKSERFAYCAGVLPGDRYEVVGHPADKHKQESIQPGLVYGRVDDYGRNVIVPYMSEDFDAVVAIPGRVLDPKFLKDIITTGDVAKLEYVLSMGMFNPSAEYMLHKSKLISDTDGELVKIKSGVGSLETCLELIATPPSHIINQGDESISQWKENIKKMVIVLRKLDQAHQKWYEEHLSESLLDRIQTILSQSSQPTT